MAVHTAAEIAAERARYWQVFVWLGGLTILEIGAVYLPIAKVGIVLILVILALTKAALVALFYMHLAVERRTLLTIAITPLVLCAFLVFMLAPDHTHMTRMQTQKAPAPEVPAGHH
jgi:cytochrome c oxidase subunit 4